MSTALSAIVDAELDRPVPGSVAALAAQLASRAPGRVSAVLFYGSALRDDALDGVLDFYLLIDDWRDWPGPRLAASAGRVLPPNVGYVETTIEQAVIRAKYAVMTTGQFRHAMSMDRIDTTIWARFSQPCICVLSRSEADRRAVGEAVVAAVTTAANWAALLGPRHASAADFWRALYLRTYAVELRVERQSRGADLVARDESRYARLLPLAWQASGRAFASLVDGEVEPVVDDVERRRAERRWRSRRRLGRPLNLLRLMKAAPTFDNAIDYVAWKIERHSGYRLQPTSFQRRHPLLAAPLLYWRLRRLGVLR